MDPNVLRVLTDPEARKDPEQLRAAMKAMGNDSRKRILSAVRINSLVMAGVGYVMIAGAVAVALTFALGFVPKEAALAALLLLPMGGLFVFLARMTAMPSASLLRNGTPLQATVVEVKALGRTIGIEKPGISATLSKVTIVLSIPQLGPAGQNVEHREYVLGGDLGRLQVGATVAVRVDPKSSRRLAFDWDAMR